MAYFAFGFPCIAGIILFLILTQVSQDMRIRFCMIAWGLQSLGITFHLGLNGVSAPLFAMAGLVGLAAGLAAIKSDVNVFPCI